MVDAGAVARSARQMRADAARNRPLDGFAVELRPADAVALAAYETFCREAIHGPAQHPLWIRAWVMNTAADAFILTVQRDGRVLAMLALEVVERGPFRVAAFMGGSHANGNFAARARDGGVLSAQDMVAIRGAVAQARPDIDLICLERQAGALNGHANLLQPFATMRSANIALATDLSGGMDAMLERMNGKRKRKKFRHQARKFEAAGGYRWIEADTPEAIDRLLDAFNTMKTVRFSKRGIADPFAPRAVQAFFRQLFQDAQDDNPAPFVLHGLEVGGAIVGVNAYSVTPYSLVCEFRAISEDDPAMSPGFFLDYIGMEKACARGKALYDFSVGNDEYKRSWCDIETQQFDSLLPLSAKGRLAALLQMGRARAVGAVKSNRRLWAFAKELRARFAGSA